MPATHLCQQRRWRMRWRRRANWAKRILSCHSEKILRVRYLRGWGWFGGERGGSEAETDAEAETEALDYRGYRGV